MVRAARLGVAPGPADADAGVVEVGDLVVGDGVVGAVTDPDADGTGEDPPAAALCDVLEQLGIGIRPGAEPDHRDRAVVVGHRLEQLMQADCHAAPPR